MFLDAQGKLSDSQAATTGATSVSTNSVDLGNVTPKRNIGDGEPMCIAFFPEAIVGAADTYTLQAITATDAALTASVKVIARTRVLTDAELTAAKIVVLVIPPGMVDQRYLGASYILGAADALTVSAYLLPLSFVQKLQLYATGVVIL